MITAEEAKNRAISVITSSELEELEKLIIDAAEQGKFSIRVPELSTPDLLFLLQVTANHQRTMVTLKEAPPITEYQLEEEVCE